MVKQLEVAMAEIELKNISKRWKDFYGAKNINLSVKDREFIVFLGPSGCGKTTTMRLIAGLEEPTAGDIYLDKKKVTHLVPKDRDIAMVFQSYGLYAHLNVYENIRFPLRVRKVEKNLHHKKVMAAAEMVKLEGFLDRRPKELSGGQRQRVALARAIVRQPNCFLMDEPLSNLDAKLRISMRAEIKNLQVKLKTTTVYVTHDQVEAMTMADRVAVMDKGEIVQLGSPSEIYERPNSTYVASFIGSPPMNLLVGSIEKKAFVAQDVKVPLTKGVSSKGVSSSSKMPLQPKSVFRGSCRRFGNLTA